MKPRNREINIFNLSMLDVISGALGAFLIIMIVLFPYYNKEVIDYQQENEELRDRIQALTEQLEAAQEAVQAARERAETAEASLQSARERAEAAEEALQAARSEAQQTQRQLEAAQQRAEAAEAEAQRNQQRAETAEQQLAKTFLVVYIRWDAANQDIDLHVVDPSGAEFYYGQKTISDRPGELSEDSQVGPGNELWELHSAPPGVYHVYAKLFDRRDSSENPVIKGRVIYRDGSSDLSTVRLTRDKEKKKMAEIEVKESGDVVVR